MYPNNIAVSDGTNSSRSPKMLTGNVFDLTIGGTLINGFLSAPVLRWKDSGVVALGMTNIFVVKPSKLNLAKNLL